MEVTQRTRDGAMAVVSEETGGNYSGAVKRRKLSNDKLRSHSLTFAENRPVDSLLKAKGSDTYDVDGSGGSGGALPCCCSTTGSTETLKVSDLEAIVETGTVARNNLDGIESTRSEFKAEPGQPESTSVKIKATIKKNSRRNVLPAGIMPLEAELEEFFAAAQEGLNERFKNKYNYDFVNDIPLKGRFEWIQVTPEK